MFCLLGCLSAQGNSLMAEGRLVTVSVPTDNIVPPSPNAPAGDNVRFVTIYLPEEYDTKPEKRFPVIYYLHSFNGNNETFAEDNKEFLDLQIAEGQVMPVICAMPDGSLINGVDAQGRAQFVGSWYVNSSVNGAFEDFFTHNIIDYIDTNFRTKAQASFRAIGGHSMGGYGSLYLGIKHPELYCAMGAESPTPIWTLLSSRARPQATPAFTMNSFLQPAIPLPPEPGKIFPNSQDVNSVTYLVYSLSAALSPDLQTTNPFLLENNFFLQLPVLINDDGTPVYGPGPVVGRTLVYPGQDVIFDNTLILDQEVVERWAQKDPFLMIESARETLSRQGIYLDGGDEEIANAVGSRIFSDRLNELGIQHEYILYGKPVLENGGQHTSCLATVACSRNITIFQLFSSMFAAAGRFPDDYRVKLVGNGTITLRDNAEMFIPKGALVGIETLPEGNPAPSTNFTIQVHGAARLLIGTSTQAGGGLQIGNYYTKSQLKGNSALNNQSINARIEVNGSQARLEIGKEGFLGIGVGIAGKEPTQPTYWSLSTLTNLERADVAVLQGSLSHAIIASSDQEGASLLGVRAKINDRLQDILIPEELNIQPRPPVINLVVDLERGKILGGGNMVSVDDVLKCHPLVQVFDQKLRAGGVRRVIDPFQDDPPGSSLPYLDFFYQYPQNSAIFYTNTIKTAVASSSEQLKNRNCDIPDRQDEVITLSSVPDQLPIQPYPEQPEKSGALSIESGVPMLEYLVTIPGNQDQYEIKRAADIPLEPNQVLNIPNIARTEGALGMQLKGSDGGQQLIRVYDLTPGS